MRSTFCIFTILSMIDFEEYIRQGEPDRQQRAYAWQTAIGLQAVDGLTTSDYLKEAACRHIEGDITIDEVRQGVRDYYRSKAMREPADDEMREADSVSVNITKILSTKTLDFSTKGFVALHRRIFEGVFKFAGKLRDYDITKKEWVLGGDTVSYLHWEDLRRAIDHDLEQERAFRYAGLSDDEMVAHITRFVSGLWQIHPFGEGNTRTTAVFLILYLRSIGFEVTNNLFAEHSWYFRNALVRANYKNARQGIDYSPVYLERFFRNLLLGERWELKNRYLHIHPSEDWREQRYLSDSENATVFQDKYRTSTGQVCGMWRCQCGVFAFGNRGGAGVGKNHDGKITIEGAGQLSKIISCSGFACRVCRDALSGISPASKATISIDFARAGGSSTIGRAAIASVHGCLCRLCGLGRVVGRGEYGRSCRL